MNKYDQLAARKELLMMKAELERMEMNGHVQAVKTQFGWFSQVKRVFNWGGSRSLATLGPLAAFGQDALKQLMGSNPYAGLAASAMLMKISPPVRGRVVQALTAATALAGAVLWFRARKAAATHQTDQSGPERAVTRAHLTSDQTVSGQ